MKCAECGRELNPAGQTLAQLPGGFLCQDCDGRRRDLERRAKRDWMQVLWEDHPNSRWVIAVLIILVIMGLLHFLEL
jgi:hypothetical protein